MLRNSGSAAQTLISPLSSFHPILLAIFQTVQSLMVLVITHSIEQVMQEARCVIRQML